MSEKSFKLRVEKSELSHETEQAFYFIYTKEELADIACKIIKLLLGCKDNGDYTQ